MTDLKTEILQLEKILSQKKKQLFFNRLEKIAGDSLNSKGIDNIDIQHNSTDKTWQISYTHKTNNYSSSMYAYSGDSDSDHDQEPDINSAQHSAQEFSGIPKETKISFGKSNKYFIKGGIKLHVYRNTAGELRVINPEYEFDLDLDEQKKLVREYSENHDLPEWFAIVVMLYLSDNEWDDAAFINHLSIV